MASVLTRLFGEARDVCDRHGERTRDIAGKRTSSDKTPFASRKKTAPIHGDRQERAGIAGATADSRPRARSICDLSVLSDLRSPTLGRPSFALCAKPRAKPQSERGPSLWRRSSLVEKGRHQSEHHRSRAMVGNTPAAGKHAS